MWWTILVYAVLILIALVSWGILRRLTKGKHVDRFGWLRQPNTTALAQRVSNGRLQVPLRESVEYNQSAPDWTKVERALEDIYTEFYGRLDQLRREVDERLTIQEHQLTSLCSKWESDLASLARNSSPAREPRAVSEASTVSESAPTSGRSDTALSFNPRYFEVLDALAQGRDSASIAQDLAIGEGEVVLIRDLMFTPPQ